MLHLVPVTGFDDTVEVPNPWGFTDPEGRSALVLRIGSTGSRGWKEYAFRKVGRSHLIQEGIERLSRSVQEAAGKGARKGGKGELRAAEAGVNAWQRRAEEHLEGVLGEFLDERKEHRAMAAHLFSIAYCNFYGLPLEDSPENRLRLLDPIPMCDPEETCAWREGGPIMAVPAVGPKDRKEWASPFWSVICAHQLPKGVEEVRKAWDLLRQAGHVESPLVDTPHVEPGERLVPLHFLIQRWIMAVADDNAQRIAVSEGEASDFLPAPPSSGAESGAD